VTINPAAIALTVFNMPHLPQVGISLRFVGASVH
jgi:hypothetical protein